MTPEKNCKKRNWDGIFSKLPSTIYARVNRGQVLKVGRVGRIWQWAGIIIKAYRWFNGWDSWYAETFMTSMSISMVIRGGFESSSLAFYLQHHNKDRKWEAPHVVYAIYAYFTYRFTFGPTIVTTAYLLRMFHTFMHVLMQKLHTYITYTLHTYIT